MIKLIIIHVLNTYWNIRCQQICKDPTSIGCSNDHMFCKECLNRYFGNNVAIKCCPTCKQTGLSKKTMRSDAFVLRLINALKVKCRLNHQNKDKSCEIKCEWIGSLGDLQNHIENNCPLLDVTCSDCDESMKRYELHKHDKKCPEKDILCELCS